jgi:hypothetical protein
MEKRDRKSLSQEIKSNLNPNPKQELRSKLRDLERELKLKIEREIEKAYRDRGSGNQMKRARTRAERRETDLFFFAEGGRKVAAQVLYIFMVPAYRLVYNWWAAYKLRWAELPRIGTKKD